MPLSQGELYAAQMRIRDKYISNSAQRFELESTPAIASQPSLTPDQIRLNQALALDGTAEQRLQRQAVYPADPTSQYYAKSQVASSPPAIEAVSPSPTPAVATPLPTANSNSTSILGLQIGGTAGGVLAASGLTATVTPALVGAAALNFGLFAGAGWAVGKIIEAEGAYLNLIGASWNASQADSYLKKANDRYQDAVNRGLKIANITNGKSSNNLNPSSSSLQPNQTQAGVNYRVSFKVTYDDGSIGYGFGQSASSDQPRDNNVYLEGAQLTGNLSGLSSFQLSRASNYNTVGLFLDGNNTGIYFASKLGTFIPDGGVTIDKIFPVGSPPSSATPDKTYTPPYGASVPSATYQNVSPDPPITALNQTAPNGVNYPRPIAAKPTSGLTPQLAPQRSPSPQQVGGLANTSPAYATPSTVKASNTGSIPAYESPAYVSPAFVAKPYVSGVSNPADYGKAIDSATGLPKGTPVDTSKLSTTPKPTDAPKPQTTPNTPNQGNTNDSINILAAIAALAATVTGGVVLTNYIKGLNEQINNQTKPEAQQNNAKQGCCDAFQPQQCGYEGVKQATQEATAPINQNVDAANALLTANQIAQDAAFVDIAANFTKVKTFLDNTIIDRAIAAANFGMNVHNALMLSNALGRTLAGVVDTALNIGGFQFTDTSGNKTTATRAFSSNVSALIVNLIGQDLYTELTDDWKVANRIYQSSTSLLNKTERLMAGQSKVQQQTGINVGLIGNALRANGSVNPNSYPPMATTKEANTPTELLADVNSPLSSIQSGIRNLNTITKSISGTVKQISGIQKEFGKLQDLTNKESKVRKSLRTQSANQAKARARFTFLQIKTIKATGKK